MKFVVQDLTSGGIDWQREKWKSGFGSKFIRQGEKNAVKYADEISFSILAPVLYLLGIFKINSESTFGSRIYMSSQGIRNYGITLFGQKIVIMNV